MTGGRAWLLVPALALAAASAWPAAIDTALGRQVAARADAPSVAPVRDARTQWLLRCTGCHGLDGRGSGAAGVPDLTRVGRWLQVPGGRDFVVAVPGVMGSGLDDAQVADLANWLLSTLARASAPAGWQPYRAYDVARVRARPLPDVAARRQQLQQQARALGLEPW